MQRSRCLFKETNLTYLCYNVAIMSFVTLTQESVVVKPNHESVIILSDIIVILKIHFRSVCMGHVHRFHTFQYVV